MTEFEDDEPEPLSFAPHRLRHGIVERKPKRDRISFLPSAVPERDFAPSYLEATSLPLVEAPARQSSAADLRAAVTQAILDTSEKLLDRARRTRSPHENARLTAYAERLKDIPHLPAAQGYLNQPRITDELLNYLQRFRSSADLSADEGQDVILKASVTAINAALCLGYWRSNPKVPPRIHDFLSAENVYGSILAIAKTRKPAAFERLLGEYAAAVDELKRDARNAAEASLKPRNPVLWAWAKFNIEKVAYYRDALDAARAEIVTDAKLSLVLFNVMLDDIADSIQDADLLEVLAAIPTASGQIGAASPEVYDALRRRLTDSDRERFIPYFNAVVESWTQAMRGIREATGGGFDALSEQLGRDYDRILKTFRFSAALNHDPMRVFHLPPGELARLYGAESFGEIIAHNANRLAFHTIDAMGLLGGAPARHGERLRSGALSLHRKSAALFQDMHQIGNSVATGAREVDSDDLSNGMFKVANDLLNGRADWALPTHLEDAAGPERHDAILRAFDLKRKAKQERGEQEPATPAYNRAQQEYVDLAGDLEQLIEISGAEKIYFQMWLDRRDAVEELLTSSVDAEERRELLLGNDLLLVLHLIYKGRI